MRVYEQKQTVREEMERILQSEPFRSSPRCSQFLRFVVEHTLEGQKEDLKERIIGIEVFGGTLLTLPRGILSSESVRQRFADACRSTTQAFRTQVLAGSKFHLGPISRSFCPGMEPPEKITGLPLSRWCLAFPCCILRRSGAGSGSARLLSLLLCQR